MTARRTKLSGGLDTSFRFVEAKDLRFDPANPRFTAGHSRSQESMQLLLEQEPHLALELVDSFLENGFITYEPLVVRKDGAEYIVVEGNRRLAAIRHILANADKYSKYSDKFDELSTRIPVLVFPKLAGADDQKHQRIYLGVRHLFGFREWPAESKARFLDGQIRAKSDLDRVLRELNIKRSEIKRYLLPYRLRKAAKSVWGPYEDQDFWVELPRFGGRVRTAVDREPRGTLFRLASPRPGTQAGA